MDNSSSVSSVILILVSATLALSNGLIIAILSSIRSDQKEEKQARIALRAEIKREQEDVWYRMYNHYHEIDCKNDDCKGLKTGDVVVPRESLTRG